MKRIFEYTDVASHHIAEDGGPALNRIGKSMA
jgi:hypothetical protein